jgi:DNA-binding transcriptional ArsR family regulator
MTNRREVLDRVFHALSDATRRAIVMRLTEGPASVSELSEPFAMAKPTMLQHIRVLEHSGLIGTQKTGRVRMCEMKPAVLSDAEVWLSRQRSFWAGRLHRMDTYVKQLHAKEKKHGDRRRKT